jgi:hypothetical protein
MVPTGPVTYVARIDRCDLHEAAQEMLDVLKAVRDTHLKGHNPGESLTDRVAVAIIHAEGPVPVARGGDGFTDQP